MFRDREMVWPDGEFPYDAMKEAGITPDSSHREVGDASLELMQKGMWNPEARAAWDWLRLFERRLWVDFLMLQADPLTVYRQIPGVTEPLAAGQTEAPVAELDRMEPAFRPFLSREEPLFTGLGPRLADLVEAAIEFDA